MCRRTGEVSMRILPLSWSCVNKGLGITPKKPFLAQVQRLGFGNWRGLPNTLLTLTTINSKMSSSTSDSASGHGNSLDAVDDVGIDATGTFKYVLIKVWPKDNKDSSKFIVRGYKWAEYHAGVFEEVEGKLQRQKFGCDCVGGGRIEHTPAKKTILVYGYSQGFGRADHSVAVEKLKARYPDYTSITFTNEGY